MKNIPFGKPVINPNVVPKIKKILNSGKLVHGVYQKILKKCLKNKTKALTLLL